MRAGQSRPALRRSRFVTSWRWPAWSAGSGRSRPGRSACGKPTALAELAPGEIVLGLGSGSTLATVVGVIVEVPVMLSVCAFCNRTRRWFPPPGESPAPAPTTAYTQEV